jgi:hypothetical protein
LLHPIVLVSTTGPAAGTKVTLTPGTIVLSPSLVKSSLVSVSADGSTYTFSSSSGPLATVAKGKVLLLEGRDAVVVTSVRHAGKDLMVGATPASLTDVVQSGTIKASAPPDTAAAIGVPLDSAAIAGPIEAAVRELPGTGHTVATLTGSFSHSGKSGGLTYTVAFTSQPGGLHATGDFCYVVASSTCGEGLSIHIALDGTFSWADQSIDLGVGGGTVRGGSFSISKLESDIKLNYTVLRGQVPNIGAKLPVFKIPFSLEMPLCGSAFGCGGIPLYAKFSIAFLVTLGISAKNSSIEGGVDLNLGGSASVSSTGLSVNGSMTSPKVSGQFLPKLAYTLASAGIVVAVQSKFGVGLGVSSINALYYISPIVSVGETTGSLVAGQSCASFDGDFSVTGNAEAQLFGHSISTPAKTLFEKKATYAQPGC